MGAQQNAAARAAAVPEPGGCGEKAVVCLGGPDAGGLLPGRRGTGAMPSGTAGAFGAGSRGVPSGRRAANGARAGLGRVGPTKAACRARRRWAGTLPGGGRGRYAAAFRGGRGEGISRAAVYGGRAGYSRRRRAYCRGAAGGGPGRAENALSCAACVGLRATGGKDGSGASEKARFRYIRKRFSRGAGFVDSELICPQKLVALVGLLFRRRRVMNVSRRAGRAKSPAGKQNAIQRKEHTP